MSVRIHAIAKEIKKTSKEVLMILAERGYELKSASSTIDNITAESLIEEFKSDSIVEDSEITKEADNTKETSETKENSNDTSKIPLVKSKEDIEREKREKEEVLEVDKVENKTKIPPNEISVGENLEVESQNSSNVPPPPVGKATAPPPPPSSAGKAHIPSPPSPSMDSSEQEGSVEGNKVIVKSSIYTTETTRFMEKLWNR